MKIMCMCSDRCNCFSHFLLTERLPGSENKVLYCLCIRIDRHMVNYTQYKKNNNENLLVAGIFKLIKKIYGYKFLNVSFTIHSLNFLSDIYFVL